MFVLQLASLIKSSVDRSGQPQARVLRRGLAPGEELGQGWGLLAGCTAPVVLLLNLEAENNRKAESTGG